MEVTPYRSSKEHGPPDGSHNQDALAIPIGTNAINLQRLARVDNDRGLERRTGDTTGQKSQHGDDWHT